MRRLIGLPVAASQLRPQTVRCSHHVTTFWSWQKRKKQRPKSTHKGRKKMSYSGQLHAKGIMTMIQVVKGPTKKLQPSSRSVKKKVGK